jgi:hypothetical protein
LGFSLAPFATGDYIVVAIFAGSESYYPSSAETFFTVTEAATGASPLPTVAPSMADQYFLPSVAAIIVVVIIVGAVIVLMLRKRP